MKLKWIGSSFFIICLVFITILLLFSEGTAPFTATKINHSVELPTGLHPILEDRSKQLIQQAAVKGIVIVITDGFRSEDDQNRLYEQGRTAGGNIVTNAKGGESYHNFGLAIDFALKTPSGDVIWDMQYDGNKNGKADWNEVVAMAKALGFEWGGEWAQFKDYPHLQMNFGLTIAQLQNGERPAETSLTADTQ